MASSQQDARNSSSLLPSVIYECKASVSARGGGGVDTSYSLLEGTLGRGGATGGSILIQSPREQGQIKLFSPQYYAACTVGGVLACGPTHTFVTPLDVLKCNMQIDPVKYKNMKSGLRTVISEQGVVGLTRGWAPTLIGYSAQGACKYGFYEYFKKYYTDLAGPEYSKKYKTLLYLAGSASAEVIADVALCPFEAVKVRVQTQPGFAKGLSDGLPKLLRAEGISGLYKGIGPLWARQVPYTMMKFATFENMVEATYKHVIQSPKEECSVLTKLGVSFAAGYVAGVGCAVVSHPADNLVSFLNNSKGSTIREAVRQMGVLGLFTRGLPARILMVGTLTAAQWSIYDSFKVLWGLPTTGGIEEHPSQGSDDSALSIAAEFESSMARQAPSI